MSENSAVLETPMGPVGVTWSGEVLTGLDLEPDSFKASSNQVPAFIAEEIESYFLDGSMRFNLSMELRGTSFQRRVWAALREIPPGRTVGYGGLARMLGTGARAVGGACRANPCPIVVPCHRVVARNGLGGFAGDTSGRKLEVKRWLLRHEGLTQF